MVSDAFIDTSDVSSSIAQAEVPAIPPEQQFIQLALATETPLLLSVLNLVEILTIPTNQVVPIFHLPAWVMGVYNWRGEILWIVDLNHLVGFSPWHQQSNYVSKHTVIILKRQLSSHDSETGDPVLGLVINRVDNIVVCEPELFQSVADTNIQIPAKIKPFLDGYRIGAGNQPEWILNGEAILRAMPG